MEMGRNLVQVHLIYSNPYSFIIKYLNLIHIFLAYATGSIN